MWIPLVCHSEYSVLQSTSTICKLVGKAKQFGFESLAITDSGSMYGSVDFYKECTKNDIKPILGMEAFLAPSSRFIKTKTSNVPVYTSIFLLAMNNVGYSNLCKISSIGYTDGFYYVPRVDMEILEQMSDGIIAITGSAESLLSHLLSNNRHDMIDSHIDQLQAIFKDNLYLQIQSFEMSDESIQSHGFYDEPALLKRHERENDRQQQLNEFIRNLSDDKGIPVVVTHDSYYINPSDWRAHEILLNIASSQSVYVNHPGSAINTPNPARKSKYSREFFFKSMSDIQSVFEKDTDAVEIAFKIAEKCNVSLDFGTKHYPVFIPPGFDGDQFSIERADACKSYLANLANQEMCIRYTDDKLAKLGEILSNENIKETIASRLRYELDIISSKDMAEYLLIVADFVNWAKQQNIPVGPGRGSGAGSIVCYLIGITDIDPIRFNLLFERFINPERISYPDIDVDICMNRRHEVINYMVDKYGSGHVAHIITFGKMKARMAIKDVARVLNIPLQAVNNLMKKVPEDINLTIEKILDSSPEIVAQIKDDESIGLLFEIARTVEGCIRNTGIHAAGVIVSGKPLIECIPVCRSKETELPVTQFSMKPLEAVGMLKIDFLGLKTLSCIQEAVSMIDKNHGVKLRWYDLDLHDKKTFDLFNSGKTCGLFQMESAGMQDLCKKLHIDCFEEIIAAVALYRPGPMEMIPSFIARKHKLEYIELDHPIVEPILKETYGVMVYQEQVMEIAQMLAGFSLAQGDVLRRAMGKKDAEEMEAQRSKFVDGSHRKGIDRSVAEEIFAKISKFAQYGFNKSHAAAYGYLTYVTGYLKANYTAEWMAALMTSDRHDIDRVSDFISESRDIGLEILPPDVNLASTSFCAHGNTIRFALNGIKGLGESFVEHVCDERNAHGRFKGLVDFVCRMLDKTSGKITKKHVEHLVRSGSLDFTGWSRDQLLESIDIVFSQATVNRKDAKRGIISLFDTSLDNLSPPEVEKETSLEERLMEEKNLLGIFITSNPLELYKELISELGAVNASMVKHVDVFEPVVAVFILEEFKIKVSKSKKKKFCVLTISDETLKFEVSVWHNYSEIPSKVRVNQACVGVLLPEGHGRISCSAIEPLQNMDIERRNFVKSVLEKERVRAVRRKEAIDNKSLSSSDNVTGGSVITIFVDVSKINMSDAYILCNRIKAIESGSVPIEVVCVGHSSRNYVLTMKEGPYVLSKEHVQEALNGLNFVEVR